MPSARITTMNAAMTALDDAKRQLESVSNAAGTEPADKTERDVAQQLLRRMGQMRSTMVETRKKVNAWKTRKRSGKSTKATGQKPSKRPKLAQEEEPDDGMGVLIGTPGFREQIKAELDDGEANLTEWYDAVTMGNPGSIFNMASTGLSIVAAGVEASEPKEMMSTLAELLAPDALELEVVGSVKHASVDKMRLEHLSEFLEETKDPLHATHKRARVELLQHIVLAVKALQWSLAWSEIEKGSKYRDGRGKVVEDMYRAHCKDKTVDLESEAFTRYATRVKDYNTGANRFLLAYQQLWSMLLLCPLLSIYRFTSSSLGAKVKKAISELVEDDAEGKLLGREANHRRILFKVINILDTDEDPVLVAAIKDIDTKLGDHSLTIEVIGVVAVGIIGDAPRRGGRLRRPGETPGPPVRGTAYQNMREK